jgi:prepilin-type N-terminal cleavage/methylation domain-containing protein
MKRWKQLYIDSSLGFTLVELMITIGVVAILTSMAVPTVQIYTEKARKVECQVSIVHYLRAQEIYYAENNSFRTGANWRVNRNGVSRLNIGWNINRRPDQAGLYHFPELGVEFPAPIARRFTSSSKQKKISIMMVAKTAIPIASICALIRMVSGGSGTNSGLISAAALHRPTADNRLYLPV